MKRRAMKTWESKKSSYYIGFDLWQWGIPLYLDRDSEFFEIHFLCFFFAVAWS